MYPDMKGMKMHRMVKSSAQRCKFICHLNSANTFEGEDILSYRDYWKFEIYYLPLSSLFFHVMLFVQLFDVADRVCTFKIVTASRDGNRTAKISKNACLKHSCQSGDLTPQGAREHVEVDENMSGETKIALAKKRKAEEMNDAFQEAWMILCTVKAFKDEILYSEMTSYLDSLGIYEATDLRDLETSHVDEISSYLKDIPKKKWLKLLISSRPN